jgi:predicted nucleic acid-binding protein
MRKAVLLDTSFFLRFLNESDPLFENTEGYYKYLIHEKYDLVISTISIAEFLVEIFQNYHYETFKYYLLI